MAFEGEMWDECALDVVGGLLAEAMDDYSDEAVRVVMEPGSENFLAGLGDEAFLAVGHEAFLVRDRREQSIPEDSPIFMEGICELDTGSDDDVLQENFCRPRFGHYVEPAKESCPALRSFPQTPVATVSSAQSMNSCFADYMQDMLEMALSGNVLEFFESEGMLDAEDQVNDTGSVQLPAVASLKPCSRPSFRRRQRPYEMPPQAEEFPMDCLPSTPACLSAPQGPSTDFWAKKMQHAALTEEVCRHVFSCSAWVGDTKAESDSCVQEEHLAVGGLVPQSSPKVYAPRLQARSHQHLTSLEIAFAHATRDEERPASNAGVPRIQALSSQYLTSLENALSRATGDDEHHTSKVYAPRVQANRHHYLQALENAWQGTVSNHTPKAPMAARPPSSAPHRPSTPRRARVASEVSPPCKQQPMATQAPCPPASCPVAVPRPPTPRQPTGKASRPCPFLTTSSTKATDAIVYVVPNEGSSRAIIPPRPPTESKHCAYAAAALRKTPNLQNSTPAPPSAMEMDLGGDDAGHSFVSAFAADLRKHIVETSGTAAHISFAFEGLSQGHRSASSFKKPSTSLPPVLRSTSGIATPRGTRRAHDIV